MDFPTPPTGNGATTSESMEIGVLYVNEAKYIEGTALADTPKRIFADVINRSEGRLSIMCRHPLSPGSKVGLKIYNRHRKSWDFVKGEVSLTKDASCRKNYRLIDIMAESASGGVAPVEPSDAQESPVTQTPMEIDYEFFRKTDLLKHIPREAVCPLLNAITNRSVKAGQRFITQGDPGNCAYVIQKGTCLVNVEKDGELTPVARLGKGAVVGEMAIITGEPRSAHVDAESDMALWRISKEDFTDISREFPELRNFLTELLTNWFDKTTMTAERRVGKYVLTDIIGKGGFSIVYRGIHESLNMPVAIKMLKHDMAMNQDFNKNFKNEAKTIAGLNHENIVRVHDIEELYRTIFIIMEHLEGMSLRKLLKKTIKLNIGRVVHYLLQICRGLQYAHQRGLVHQDIKPGNIYILPDERIKILDFGLACACGSENFLTGTPFYMSPEQIDCVPVDERADIYALGITAFEMTTGRRPFEEKDAWTVMDTHLNCDIPDPAEFEPEIPEGLRKFILKACARDPGDRYRNVSQILEELQPLTGHSYVSHQPAITNRPKAATLLLLYAEEHQSALDRLMEEFCMKVNTLGASCKPSSAVRLQ